MRTPLRVVAFTPGHTEIGGAARRSRLLCEELARRGHDVRVVTRAASGRRLTVRREPHLVVVEVPGLGGTRRGALGFLLVALALGLWWARRDTVLLAIQLASPATAAAVVGRLVRRPFVALSTTSGPLSEVSHLAARNTCRRRLVARAATLVAQTPLGAHELAALVPPERVTVLPTPVERVDEWPLNGAGSALFAGRFSQEKDLPLLLEAWREVVAARPGARLVLAGEGGRFRSVEAVVRGQVTNDPLLRTSVELPGWVVDMPALLRRHDVFVFPSTSEGMSNSLVEACATGRVVVASDIAPNVAVLGPDHPLLFRTGDRDALVAALHRALADPCTRSAAVSHATSRARGMLLVEVGTRLEEVLRAAAHRARP